MSSGMKENAIAKIRYTHDAMIDLIIAQPEISQGQIAVYFGYTQGWVSQVLGADAFKARLAERKGEVVDPVLAASIEEQLEGLARQSMDVLRASLAANPKPDVALKTLEITTRSLGFGVKAPQVQVNNVIAFVPEKAKDGSAWEAAFRPTPRIIEAVQSTEGD